MPIETCAVLGPPLGDRLITHVHLARDGSRNTLRRLLCPHRTRSAMKGDPSIIEALNDILTAELTAINQYYVHYKMCENWGYKRLASRAADQPDALESSAEAAVVQVDVRVRGSSATPGWPQFSSRRDDNAGEEGERCRDERQELRVEPHGDSLQRGLTRTLEGRPHASEGKGCASPATIWRPNEPGITV